MSPNDPRSGGAAAQNRGRLLSGAAAAVALILVVGVVRWQVTVKPDLVGPAAASDGAVGSAGSGRLPAKAPPEAEVLTDILSVTDAGRHGDVWFVLDWSGRQIHRIGAAGELLGTFAREGEGPGELRRPAAIAVHGDTIVVADEGVVRLYAPNGDHIADRRFEVSDCHLQLPTVDGMASVDPGILLHVDCVDPSSGGSRLAWLLGNDGTQRALASRRTSPAGEIVFDFNSIPVLTEHPSGFLFGDVRDDCLDLLAPDGARLEQVCHEWLSAVPVPPDIVEIYSRGADEVRRYAGQRRILGIPRTRIVELDPERLWPFSKVFAVGTGRLVYAVPEAFHPNGDRAGHRLRSRLPGGEEADIQVPAAADIFVAESSVLAVWNELHGTRVAVYDLEAS